MTSSEASLYKNAADKEFRSLQEKDSVKRIRHHELPSGLRPIKCKWVFLKEAVIDSSLERYKARYTAKGFNQREGVDYPEILAPTSRSETGRILLALAHQFGWHQKQVDNSTVFLNPNIDIDLYMELPQGFERDGRLI